MCETRSWPNSPFSVNLFCLVCLHLQLFNTLQWNRGEWFHLSVNSWNPTTTMWFKWGGLFNWSGHHLTAADTLADERWIFNGTPWSKLSVSFFWRLFCEIRATMKWKLYHFAFLAELVWNSRFNNNADIEDDRPSLSERELVRCERERYEEVAFNIKIIRMILFKRNLIHLCVDYLKVN